MADWEPAEKVQKNDAGEFRAMIGGAWVPVAKAQKSDTGEYRVMRGETAAPAAVAPAPPTDEKSTDWRENLAAGATAIPRAIANLPSKLLDAPWLKSELDLLGKHADKDSAAYTAGTLLDPAALAIGSGGFQAAQKIPAIGNYLRNVVAGAGTGAAIGGLSEDGTAGSGAAVGAGLSAVLGPLGYLGKKAWDTGRNLASGSQGQASNYLAELFGGSADRAKVADRLLAIKSGVSGDRPTTGMAAVVGGEPMPVLKALEERARTSPSMAKQFASRDTANEAARALPLEVIAAVGRRQPAAQGMPTNLSRVEGTRKNITSPLYAEAGKDILPVDKQLLTTLSGAEIQPAANRAGASLDQATANALAAGRTPPPGYTQPKVTPPPEGTPYWAQNPAPQATVEPATVSVNALQRIKNEIDKDITSLSGTTDSAGATKLAQLKVARGQIDQWMRKGSQKWTDAQDTFKALSIPQNQADVAEVLLRSLQSPAGLERATAFGTAFRNAPQTITKAGVPRFEELGQVFSPTQMKWANAVKESVDREAQYAALKAPQSILPDVKNALDTVKESSPNWLNATMTAFHKVMAKAGGRLDQQSQVIIDGLMLEPTKLAAFLNKATPAESDMIRQYVASIPSGAPTAAITASTQNKRSKDK
jgi:hypothetical protein